MKNDISGYLLFKRLFFGSYFYVEPVAKGYICIYSIYIYIYIYILQEINPRWLQMKKWRFMKTPGKIHVFDRESPVFTEI